MTKPKMLPDAERLRDILDYDPESGTLSWRARPRKTVRSNRRGIGNTRWAGKPAGSTHSSGHRNISIDGERYFAHRVIWKWMTGEEPEFEVDHADTDKANDRWSNLRLATHSQNSINRPIRPDNTSGARGVDWNKAKGKWRVRIHADGRCHSVGYFVDLESARAAYAKAAAGLHGEYARIKA